MRQFDLGAPCVKSKVMGLELNREEERAKACRWLARWQHCLGRELRIIGGVRRILSKMNVHLSEDDKEQKNYEKKQQKSNEY